MTANNVHWHPSGRFLAVNINTQNRVAFFDVTGAEDAPILRPWGNVVEVGADPFVGRFTPDGRHYLTANWGRNFAAKNLEGRIPQTPSTISVIRLADPTTLPQSVRHDLLGGAETGLSSEGIAISPDGQLVATVNMRGTAFPPGSARFHRDASVTLLSFDPATGAISRLADYPFAPCRKAALSIGQETTSSPPCSRAMMGRPRGRPGARGLPRRKRRPAGA
ncbi:lactonase family protein [Rhizobium leguminosarum]|uniref:lactonase family protein n=1 Tax=Rhizobium leguminosarum TaxID=384 RepID=UPI0021BC13A8|nr:lactonase family protein [Rhizobium leguminosarum]